MKASFNNYEIEFVLVCDQVRQEKNGKLIAIGIYGTDILMNEVPSIIPLALLVRLKTKNTGPHRIEVRYLLDGAIVAGFESQMAASADGEVMGSLPEIPIQLMHAGTLLVQVRDVPESAWQELVSIPVKNAPAG